MKQNKAYMAVIHTIFILLTLSFLLPFIIIVIVSISPESQITTYGFQLIPQKIDFTAYGLVLKNAGVLFKSIIWTLFISATAPALAVMVNALMAYPLARNDYSLRKPVNVLMIVSMMFSGGLIPTYIIYTQVYHLGGANPMLYWLSSLFSVWNVILFRTFFKGIPAELIESATIDGATQPQVLFHVVAPLSKSIVSIQYFTSVIARWNDYQTSLIYYPNNQEYWTVQYYMQTILQSVQQLKASLEMQGLRDTSEAPVTTLKYAMCVISIIPVFIMFPYVQKFFSKGIAVGSVKG
ncbi:MAG: carbohydrate ABC transporter permease [Clostridia bacterium]|nr:carbohydrate ABC transporter permease [Clostridia bacterium]